MSAKSATLAKSLHTVSALVAVARIYLALCPPSAPFFRDNPQRLCEWAVGAALHGLGYGGAADPYGLAARAVALLAKESALELDAAARIEEDKQ